MPAVTSRHSLTEALGLPARAVDLYHRLLPGSGSPLVDLAAALFMTPEELTAGLELLTERELVRVHGGRVFVSSPSLALGRAVEDQAESLGRISRDLARLAAVLPTLSEPATDVSPGASEWEEVHAIDGEVVVGGDAPGVVVDWINTTTGDLCFMRPDQWRLPSEPTIAAAVNAALRSGRVVRALYPSRALTEAPGVLAGRAAVGEKIRLLPEVPSRMFVVSGERALIPERLGVGAHRRMQLRQPGLVELISRWFDQLWSAASAVPMLDRGEARPDLRRLLLAQLANGANDDQIARTLDISIRTVRRRVAALMVELGADTRFQAGVEATRRGWL